MTQETNKKLQFITKKVREACPETMELKFGCFIRLNNGKKAIVINKENYTADNNWTKNDYFVASISFCDESCNLFEGNSKCFAKDIKEIIGTPITIAEILRTIPADKNVEVGGIFIRARHAILNVYELEHDLNWHAENKPETINLLATILGYEE